jgi:hypothetical protein
LAPVPSTMCALRIRRSYIFFLLAFSEPAELRLVVFPLTAGRV